MTILQPVETPPAPIDYSEDIESDGLDSGPSEDINLQSRCTRTIEEDTRRVLAEQPTGFDFDKQEAFVRVMLDEAISKRNPRLMIALLNRLWPQPKPAVSPPPMVDAPIKIIYLPQEAKGTLPDQAPAYIPQQTPLLSADDELSLL